MVGISALIDKSFLVTQSLLVGCEFSVWALTTWELRPSTGIVTCICIVCTPPFKY